MKKNIHPTYYSEADITCTCGAKFIAGSTMEKITVESCSQCHPFFTGKQKFVDSTGRLDRFIKLREKSAEIKKQRENLKSKQEKKAERIKRNKEKQDKKMAESVVKA